MTCPHAETTAILAVFDEAPPDFADHLAGCCDCQTVVAEHRQTIAVITPVLSAPAPSTRRWPILALLLAAAVTLIVLRPTPPIPAPLPSLTTLDTLDDSDLHSMELELALMDLED
ncbi:MAG: hypothetical protein ACI8RZ_006097 [Myxococcota bacterium]|jgi:hypothetical protein